MTAVVCLLCYETIHPGEPLAPGVWMGTDGYQHPPHVECALRSVMGGIGHHLDHELWCVERGDPDGGLSYRESALAVARLIAGDPTG